MRSSIEALEARKLLFSLTVTDDPDGDGIGTATATFGYLVPFIIKEVPDVTTPEDVAEEFEDEDAPWTTFVPAAPPSGTFFDGSGIRLTYSTISTQPVILVVGNDTQPNGDPVDDRDLQVILTTNDSATFSFFETSEINPPAGTISRLATSIAVTIGGLDIDPSTGSKIELLRDGVVVATLRGNQLAAIRQQVLAGGGTPEQTNQNFRYVLNFAAGFDAFRISSSAASPDNNTYFDRFYVDDITQTIPSGRFGAFNEERIFGIRVVLTGPINASAEFLDLYGRQMRNTLALGIPPQSSVALVDRNDDGVPDFNDGIGRINLSGVNASTTLTMVGGEIAQDDEDGFEFTLVDSIVGLFDTMQEEGGFGFTIADPNGENPSATGLPPAGGSIVIGSPFVRDNSDPGFYTGGINPANNVYTNPQQGIFVTQAGTSMGSVVLHGMLMGSSQFTGALGRMNVGVLLGSVTVQGDLGHLFVAGDAGAWTPDEGVTPRALVSTQNELFVGRTAGEIAIGGRSLIDITVAGNINDPNRIPLPFYEYREKEFIFGIDPAIEDGLRVTNNAILFAPLPEFQAMYFGTDLYRNDSISGAEYVGYGGTAVHITGDLGFQDPVNTSEDPSDVYAFAADGSTDVVINLFFDVGQDAAVGLVRIVDSQGRVLASHQNLTEPGAGDEVLNPLNGRFVFRPDHADVYYLVVNVPQDTPASFAFGITYEMTISGMAPTTLGSYRTGAANGARLADSFLLDNTLNVGAGNLGLVRIGTGFVGGDGAETGTDGLINPDNDDLDIQFEFRRSSISVAGNLYGLWTGSDVAGAQVFIGGNLGSFITGQSPVIGVGITEGDIDEMTLNVGGSIASIFVGGNIGWPQDDVNLASFADSINIRTGINGGRGDIGSFLIGNFMSGPTLNVITSPQSTIDRFVVGASPGGSGQIIGREGLNFLTGLGSDVRFVDFTSIDSGSNPNLFLPLIYGQSVTLSDDAGGTVTIRIVGSAPGQAPLASTSFGTVRMLPINGSLGVAIGRLDVNLNGGAVLEIIGNTPGTVSIGHINVIADGTTGSQILINSAVTEIDVWQITQTGGALGLIRNNTPNGDFVSIDVAGLQQLVIASGSLGRTQVSGAGPSLLGPFLGVQSGFNTTVGGALGINPASVDPQWNGTVFLPLNFPSAVVNRDETLEDLGSPFDGYLNGMVVRGGDVLNIQVAGSVGDVILQGVNSVLVNLIANFDGATGFGGFDGIVGTIYAGDILTIDIGDGLAEPGSSPFAVAGIFADDDIQSVRGRSALRPVINGVILARNVNPFDAAPGLNGLVSVHLVQGRYDGAFIGSSKFDEFWNSARFSTIDNGGDDLNEGLRGPVVSVSGQLTDFFRSRVVGAGIGSLDFGTNLWDASSADAVGDIGSILAGEFRNSTILGEPSERRINEIRASGNIGRIAANGSLGDISDLLIDAQGSLTGNILARNFTRANIQIDGTINSIFSSGDIRSTNVAAGRLTSLDVAQDIRATAITIAGPITIITAGANITNSRIVTSGPDGRIDTLRARYYLTGDIISSGAVTLITSTEGDIIASIQTIASSATVGTISAGRDIIIDTDFASDVGTISAGRHIGQLNEPRGGRVINVRGNLNTISAPNGQIYTDIRVAEAITGVIRNGRVVALPGNDQVSRASIVAYGRISLADLHGDFNGSIISESGGIGSITITDGSFRPGNVIRANDGSIDSVRIVGGHLLGDIIAEEAIGTITLAPNAAGFWGDIGVTGWLSQHNPFDPFRNQLPPGVEHTTSFQGPRIQAGTNITLVDVQRGGMWESSIVAGHSIGRVFISNVVLNDYITPGLNGSFIVAGDTVNNVEIGGFAGGLIILAGVTDLGADNRPGGTGANTDTVQFGRMGNIVFRDSIDSVTIAAGINAGADGFYTINPGADGIRFTADDILDDAVANGLSWINSVSVGGVATQSTVFADNGIGATAAGIVRGGPGLHQAEPDKVIEFVPSSGFIPAGGLDFTTTLGETGRITLTGPGQAYFEHVFDDSLGRMVNRLALINTSQASRLIVDTTANRLTDFHILSNDSASLGFASIRADLFGDSSFYFDGYVDFAEFGRLDTTGDIGAGNDVQTLIVGPTTRGHVFANHIQNLIVGGDFGLSNVAGEASIRLLSGGPITIFGAHNGLISITRDIGAIQINGAATNAEIRAGRSIGSLNVAAMTNVKVSARNDIGAINIPGSVTTSSIYAGADLGADGTFGGSGLNADVVTNGNIASVTVGGNFIRSDIAAGLSRGVDNFLGTPDDFADEGHSAIGPVNISGVQVGSNLNSESFRIVSNGTVAAVRVGANPNFQASGNFSVNRVDATPDALQVANLRVAENAGVYTAFIQFNQPILFSSFSPALNIFEVRDGGTRTVRLAENVDFSVSYNAATNTAAITFAQSVTQRNLPQLNGVPGPGVYRFTLDAAVLRGQTQTALLDGNGNGVPEGVNDDYSADAFVGDVGDKIDPDLSDNNSGGIVLTGNNGERVDYYFAGDLNLVLDNNYTPDGLPDVNQVFTVNGSLGDHPDHNTNFFPFAGDYDVFKITLRAGQILRLGKMGGVAIFAGRQLMDASGNFLSGSGNLVQELPANPLLTSDPIGLIPEQQFLIRQTGTYYITVAAPVFDGVVNDVTAVPPNQTSAGTTGSYNFTIEVFDDGDTGFNSDTDSGNGIGVVNAPTPVAFAGSDNLLNTADDLGVVTIGTYQFFLDAGPDGIKGSADDFISGRDHTGIFSQRTSGADGLFGTTDDALNSFIDASIGRPGSNGVPTEVQPDADVFVLNNGNTIAAGTRVRAVLKLTEFGSNLGLTPDSTIQDLRGSVQFGIFNITNSTGVADADLLAAPGNVIPIGGTPNQVLSDGVTSYGFDANGDFFIDFIIPANAGNAPGRFALYVQGAMRTDYQLQITTQGTGATTRTTQNLLLETRGGMIDWLEAGGITTNLSAFRASVAGFSGLVDGQTADNYILNNLLAGLNELFLAANVDINVSTDPSAFQGQNFSTVFLTGSNEPLAFFNNGTFGASEHSDAFNVDPNDQGVVFVPSLGVLGYTPSRVDIDNFVDSLTAAVARRVGELVGLRMLSIPDTSLNDVMAADSVRNLSPLSGGTPLPGPYRFSAVSTDLSPPELLPVFITGGQGRFSFLNEGLDRAINTDFFLGQQNSLNLLNRLLLPPG